MCLFPYLRFVWQKKKIFTQVQGTLCVYIIRTEGDGWNVHQGQNLVGGLGKMSFLVFLSLIFEYSHIKNAFSFLFLKFAYKI